MTDPRKLKPRSADEWFDIVDRMNEAQLAVLRKLAGFDEASFMREQNFMILFARAAGALDWVNAFRQLPESERERMKDQVLAAYEAMWVRFREGLGAPEIDMKKYPWAPDGPES